MRKNLADPLAANQRVWLNWRRIPGQVLVSPSMRQNMLLLLANMLAGGLAYLLHPLLSRMLSLQAYGEVATFISLALVLSTLTQTIATVAAKYTSTLVVRENGADLPALFSFLTLLLLATGLVATLLFVAWSDSLVAFFHLTSQREVIILSLIFFTLFAIPLNQGTIQGLQFFGWYALLTLLIAFLRLFFSLALVLFSLGVNGVILGIVCSMLVTYVISFWPLRRLLIVRKGLKPSLSLSYNASTLLAFFTTGIVSLGIVVLSSLDTMLARHFLSPADTGLYAALATIGRTTLFVTSGIAVIMFPKIVALHARGEPHNRLVVQAMLSVIALSVMTELLFCLIPMQLTKLLFGPTFLAIASLLPRYGLAMLFLACAQTLAFAFLATGKRAFALVIVGACLLEVALIAWRHAGIEQMVLDVLLANALLTLALVLIWVRSWLAEQRRVARQARVY